jgi:two-component system, cell cycle sensor histidine kinase and response regulator CckA
MGTRRAPSKKLRPKTSKFSLKKSIFQERDVREYAEALAATVREPLIALDGELRVIAANAPFYSAFRLTPEETQNQPLLKIAHGAWDIPTLRQLLNSPSVGDGFTQGFELEHNFGAAGRKALSINLRRIPASGVPRVTLLAIEDISERRRAEETLAETMARYSSLAREASVGLLQTNAEGECSFANAHAAFLAGVPAKQALGKGWMKNVPAGDVALLETKLKQAAHDDEGLSIEVRFVYPQGPIAWAHLILIPLRHVVKKAPEYLIALTDITPRKDLEDRLAQAQKMEAIGRLAGGVAHDFNNMLTAISAYAAQLLEGIPEDHAAHTAAVQINKLSEHSALITRQLLAFSRKQVLKPRSVEMNSVLREMHDLLARMLGEGIEMSLFLQPDAGNAVVDLAQIQQVLLNLALNARDAMPEGGQLSISTQRIKLNAAAASRDGLAPGDYVLLSVKDTGIGMDAQTRERMFEPFFTTKPLGSGTGLGLSTAYGIIKQSGGTVRVESAPKRGTTFRLYLPRSGGELDTPRLEPAHVSDGGSETVLVVEDAAVMRSLIRELLEQRGYTVLEASDAREALDAEARDGPIHLLLTDVVMPGMNGHELAQKLRRRSKDLRVIYMSGYSGESLQAVEKEANFLEKPFKPHALANLVRKVLDKR